MLSILSRLLWFVLAGFILGFATSTIWEWYYYRGKRLATGNRRVLELETELQRKDELIAELNRTIDANGKRIAAETSTPRPRWHQDEEEPSFTRRTENWSTASASSSPSINTDIYPEDISHSDSEGTSGINQRVSDVLPVDALSSEQTAKVRQFTRGLEETTHQGHATAQSSPVAHTRDNLETRIPPRPSQAPASTRPVETEPRVDTPTEENNEPLITFRRGPARPHYSEVKLRPQQTASSSVRAEPYSAEPSQPQDDYSQSRHFPSDYSDTQTTTEPFEEEDGSDLATNESTYLSRAVETEAPSLSSRDVDIDETQEATSAASSVDERDASSTGHEDITPTKRKDEVVFQVSEHSTAEDPAPESTQRPTVRSKSSRNPSKTKSRPQSQSSSGSETTVQSESVVPSVTKADVQAPKSTEVSNHPDDLTQIDGIGPVLCRNLYGGGIYTWHQLSQANKEELSSVTKDDKKINGWKRQARELAQKNKRTDATYSGKTPSVFKEIRALKSGDPQVLYRSGITTFEELAMCNLQTLKTLFLDVAGGNTKNFTNWIKRAKELQS